MDETMRTIIAYGELMCGLPLVFAKIIWFVPSAILTKILAKVAARMDHIIDAAIEGFISMLVACLVFDRLELHIAFAVPIILIIVNSLWDWAKEEAFRAWSATAGIMTGFFLYPVVLAYLANKIGTSPLLSFNG